jgi:truncated hemoglobin YjbI
MMASARQRALTVKSVAEDRIAAACFPYTAESRPLHDRLKEVLTQFGGIALQVMLHRAGTFDMDTPLRHAGEALSELRQALQGLPVPAEAAHHHHHLCEAAREAGRAHDLIATARKVEADEGKRRELAAALRRAADHLRFATRILPGFEIVDFKQSCCAAHATTLRAEPVERLTF